MGMFDDIKRLSELAGQAPQMREAMAALNANDEDAITGASVEGSGKVVGYPTPAPEAGLARMHIQLEVTVPGRAAYQVDHVFNAARMREALMPGVSVPVKVDAADPNRLAIEWEKVAPAGMPNFDRAMKTAGFPGSYTAAPPVPPTAPGVPPAPVAAPPAAAAPGGDWLERLTKLGKLRDEGILTEAEFAAQKTKILASRPS
jgi:hypothetical protein